MSEDDEVCAVISLPACHADVRDQDPFVDHPTNILVDDTAQEDNTQVEEALEDDDAMDVDEGDTCEEDGEEEVEVTEETKGAIEPTSVVSEVAEDDAEDAEDDGEDGDEDAEDAEEDAGDAEEDAEENEEDDAEPVATSDLSELPEEEWDEDAFYDTSLPTEKNPFDIVPGYVAVLVLGCSRLLHPFIKDSASP